MNESLDQALKFHKNGNLDKAEKIYLNILKKIVLMHLYYNF